MEIEVENIHVLSQNHELYVEKNNDVSKNSVNVTEINDDTSVVNEWYCNTSEDISSIIESVNQPSIKSVSQLNLYNTDLESDEDHSKYEAVVSRDCREVALIRERPSSLPLNTGKRRLLKISPEEISSPDSPLSDDDKVFIMESDSHDDNVQTDELNVIEKIPELTLKEERADSKNWKIYTVNGVKKKIDMKVIEPYKRVLSHGGYLTTGSYNAIITFSACFLPHKSRVDYNYVMDNLFLYVLFTLNQLVTDDYVLVYLHGGTSRECIPTFSWLKKCYQMIDRKLKKNLKALYLVHPTFWLKTLLLMIKPFISSKFSRKIHYANNLTELYKILPVEEASIPDRVKQYDSLK